MSDVLSRLTMLLRNNRDQLLRNWSDRLRAELPRANELSEEELYDYVPKLIDDLIDSLARGMKGNAAPGQEIGTSEAAKAHVRHRFEQTYALADLLRELSVLRAVVIDLCAREGVVLGGAEAQLVHSAIDEVMVTAACEMAEMISADLRRDVALRELFVAVLGHDLRTPITTIQLTLRSLLGKDAPAPVGAAYARMLRAAERMQRMVADLLDMTRIRVHGGLPIHRQPTDLRAICQQVIGEVSLRHANRPVAFDARGDTQGDWDPDRMSQLVANLVGNAFDHSPPGTPVRMELRSEDGGVVFEVNNRGPAIPLETIATIFEPFRRGAQNEPITKFTEGLGLGLFIAKEIAKAHGGRIDLTSDEQNGTTFTATLPRGT